MKKFIAFSSMAAAASGLKIDIVDITDNPGAVHELAKPDSHKVPVGTKASDFKHDDKGNVVNDASGNPLPADTVVEEFEATDDVAPPSKRDTQRAGPVEPFHMQDFEAMFNQMAKGGMFGGLGGGAFGGKSDLFGNGFGGLDRLFGDMEEMEMPQFKNGEGHHSAVHSHTYSSRQGLDGKVVEERAGYQNVDGQEKSMANKMTHDGDVAIENYNIDKKTGTDGQEIVQARGDDENMDEGMKDVQETKNMAGKFLGKRKNVPALENGPKRQTLGDSTNVLVN